MKPTNSPTQRPTQRPTQPNKNYVIKVAFGPLFPREIFFSWVGIGFVQETDYYKPNPTKCSANIGVQVRVRVKVRIRVYVPVRVRAWIRVGGKVIVRVR